MESMDKKHGKGWTSHWPPKKAHEAGILGASIVSDNYELSGDDIEPHLQEYLDLVRDTMKGKT